MAQRYVQMHGSAGARKKLDQLKAKKSPTARDRELIAALQSVV